MITFVTEKVNAYLKQKLGFDNVYRLSDGIISYESWAADGRESYSRFQGKNYVFDGRRKRFLTDYIEHNVNINSPHEEDVIDD